MMTKGINVDVDTITRWIFVRTEEGSDRLEVLCNSCADEKIFYDGPDHDMPTSSWLRDIIIHLEENHPTMTGLM